MTMYEYKLVRKEPTMLKVKCAGTQYKVSNCHPTVKDTIMLPEKVQIDGLELMNGDNDDIKKSKTKVK